MKQDIESKVAELGAKQPWNHNFILPFNVKTKKGEQSSQGKNLVKWERIKTLVDNMNLEGKRILDIGCNEGYFSFKLSEYGSELLGIDVDIHRIEKAKYVQSVLGSKNVEFRVMNIYDRDFMELDKYDICLCLGFLHRIPDPFTAIESLTKKANIIIFEWKALKFGPHDEPFAYFTPGAFNKDNLYSTQYWLLSYTAVIEMLARLGFTYIYKVDDPFQKRALLVAGCVDNPIFHRSSRILQRNKLHTFLSHTKRYLLTIRKIINGKLNY